MQHNEAQPLEDVNRNQDAPSLGQILKRAREDEGLTLEQVCAELRFEQHLLEALEADRLDELGPPVFAKGYIKHYGQRLGLSYDDLLARYYDVVGRQDVVIEPSRAIRLRDERQIAVWVIAAVALGLIGVVLFIWWSNEAVAPVEFPPPAESSGAPVEGATPVELQSPSRTPDAADEDTAAAREPGATAGNVDTGADAGSDPSETSRAAESAGGDAAAPAESGAARGDGAAPAAASDAAGASAATAPAADATARSALDVAPLADSDDNGAPLPADATRVELVFAEDSWAEVTDARGEQLVYGLMQAGEREAVAGAGPLSVLLGNAAGVRVRVDGEPYSIPAAARRGDLAEFTVGEPEN